LSIIGFKYNVTRFNAKIWQLLVQRRFILSRFPQSGRKDNPADVLHDLHFHRAGKQ